MEYKDIKNSLEKARADWNKFRSDVNDSWDFNLPYGDYAKKIHENKEYQNYTKWRELEILHRPTYNLRDPEEWEIEECKMTVEDFVQACEYRMFTGYDGDGYYGTEDKISDIPAEPETVINSNMRRKDFTHVWWYNK